MAFLVAADGAVKRTGWNYRFVLGALSAAKPPLSPDALARTIVDHVATLEGDVSLAGLNLDKSEAMEEAFEELVATLQAVMADPDEAEALFIMLKRTSYLQVRQFLDLRDPCHQMRAGFGGAVATAADKVLARVPRNGVCAGNGDGGGTPEWGQHSYCPLFRAREPFGGRSAGCG